MVPADVEDRDGHRIVSHLDDLLADRGMTLTELADRVGVTVVNLSVLKNNRAKAVRFSTLTAICDVLGCEPGDVLGLRPRTSGSPELRRTAVAGPLAVRDPATDGAGRCDC